MSGCSRPSLQPYVLEAATLAVRAGTVCSRRVRSTRGSPRPTSSLQPYASQPVTPFLHPATCVTSLQLCVTSLQPCVSQAGVKGMRAGEYRAAVTAFTQAIASYPGGMTSRKGGEYAVWLAQALHAKGQTAEAKKLLMSIEKHPDGDVRSVADSVLYIYQAPTHIIFGVYFACACACIVHATCINAPVFAS